MQLNPVDFTVEWSKAGPDMHVAHGQHKRDLDSWRVGIRSLEDRRARTSVALMGREPTEPFKERQQGTEGTKEANRTLRIKDWTRGRPGDSVG